MHNMSVVFIFCFLKDCWKVSLIISKPIIMQIFWLHCLLRPCLYIGLTTFLVVTECVQRSYVQLSPHRWGLITGLKGYMVSANSKMGLKVFIWSDTAWPASPSRSGSFCGGLCCSTCIWNISLQTWIFSLALVPIIF